MPSNYWWVNHKQTEKIEIKDGFLWAPDTKLFHHVNVQNVLKGDFVVSYAHGKISHFGIVTEKPFMESIPDKFRKVSKKWSKKGWKAPVAWEPLKFPFRPTDHFDKINPLLSDRYAPLQKKDDNRLIGNQCYLCKIELLLFNQVKQIGKINNDQAIDKIGDQALEVRIPVKMNTDSGGM